MVLFERKRKTEKVIPLSRNLPRETRCRRFRDVYLERGEKLSGGRKMDRDVLGAQHTWWKGGLVDDGGGVSFSLSPDAHLQARPWRNFHEIPCIEGERSRNANCDRRNFQFASLTRRHLLLDFHLLASTLSDAPPRRRHVIR